MSAVFKVNSPNVVCEAIDGEVVIVSLDTGSYYSLLGTGADLWQGLEKQLSTENLVDLLTQRYDQEQETVAPLVHQFIDRLQQEALIVLDSETTINPKQQTEILATVKESLSDVDTAATFAPPNLEKFSDMEDLLLLDPVHEVEESEGWPQAKSTESSSIRNG